MSLSKTLNPFFAMDYPVPAAGDTPDGSIKLERNAVNHHVSSFLKRSSDFGIG
jgi:hypothetical protein